MNRVSTAIALVLLGASSVVAAQSYQQTPSTPANGASAGSMNTPPSSGDTGSNSSNSSSSSSASTHHQQMKDCIAQQQANNSGMTKAQAKKACKNQLNGSPQG